VLAEPLVAGADLPAYDNSAMDGWAVSGPPPWRVMGEVWADGLPVGRLDPGECVAIATGAAIPAGTDRVIPVELSTLRGDQVALSAGAPHRSHIRRRGEEARHGDVLLPAGTLVTPAVAGLAAAAGRDTLPVVSRAEVELLVLGDELVTEGSPGAGRVRDALGPQLPSWLDTLGAGRVRRRRVADDLVDLTAALRAARADLVVTTGGTSRGARDHLREALGELDARIVIDGVAVKPGHPMLLAVLPGSRWLVALPGNPMAACVGVMTLVDPLLRRLHSRPLREPMVVALTEPQHPRPGDVHRLLPASRQADGTVRLLPGCGSGMLRGLAQADGLVVVPPAGAPAGATVDYLPLPWTTPW
jgi:molybdopterin molybdotransferase